MSSFCLEIKSGFTGARGNFRNAASVDIAATVEHHGLDAGLDSTLADELANLVGGALLVAILQLALRAGSAVDALTSVTPLVSSMIWA